jgi:hypothetical protein
MTLRTIVATATLVGVALALAMPAEAATKRKKSYVYYRQSDPAYYAPPGSRRRLTVQPRSYLSAGTETKQYEEHYADYAFPPGGSWNYQNRNSAQGSFTRMPLNDAWDIPGQPKF